jgi:hypothetical protein
MKRQTLLLAVVVIFTVCPCTNNMALGQTDYTAVASDDWAKTTTWDLDAVPTASDDVIIEDDYEITIGTGDTADAFRVFIGQSTDGKTGKITMTGGRLWTNRTITLGGWEGDSNGTGIMDQSGGDVVIGAYSHPAGSEMLCVGDDLDTKGYYNLSGGTLEAKEGIRIGYAGWGQIDQTGGQVTGSILEVGCSGTASYLLKNGSVTTSSYVVVGWKAGGDGAVIQSGGALNVGGNLYLADAGDAQYALNGGTLDVTGRLFVGLDGSGATAATLEQASGAVTVDDVVWIANTAQSDGTYSLSGDAIATFKSDLNVCAAVDSDGGAPSGASGALEIDGENVTITVDGNLDASGASVDSSNSSLFSFTTGDSDDVSTISVAGSADIDGAVFEIIEKNPVAVGTVVDLITTVGGVDNVSTASVGPHATGAWVLQLGGNSDEVLQAVKVPEPSSVILVAMGVLALAVFGRAR